jgi:hypothetical protein
MAANVYIREWNGSSGSQVGTVKNSTTIRFKNADNATVDLNGPLIVPTTAGGAEHSFEKWVRLQWSSGAATQLSDHAFYTDGTNNYGAGVLLWAGITTGYGAAEYITPQVPDETKQPAWGGTSGNVMVDAFTYKSTASLALSTNTYTSSGEMGKHLILCMELSTAATQGVLSAETGTWSWSEI